MTAGGWVLMIVSMGAIVSLNLFCITRFLRKDR